MNANCGIRLVARRLCVAALGTAALSLFWSAPALAQVGAPVTQTTAPVVQAAAPVAQTAAPVVQAAAPVAQTAATPVAEVAAPVVQTIVPVVQMVARVVETATPILETPRSSTTPVLPVSAGNAPFSWGAEQPPAGRPVENPGSRLAGADHPARRVIEPKGPLAAPLQLSEPLAFPTASSTATSGSEAPNGTEARPLSAPGPNTPSGPSVPSSAAAVFSGSGASIFVAALVAALVLAVPGLSRRLRLELAPWPLPTALPSLERPG